MLDVKKAKRVFIFNGRKLADLDPNKSVADIKMMYLPVYPELGTAIVEEIGVVGNELRYEFKKAVGTKG